MPFSAVFLASFESKPTTQSKSSRLTSDSTKSSDLSSISTLFPTKPGSFQQFFKVFHKLSLYEA